MTHSFVGPENFPNMSRWYQEDENTQIFRLFPGDDNIRNLRANAPRSEAFGLVSWKRGDGWYEWSGRYTFLQVREGAVLQIKHNSTYWSMQLILDENPDGTFDLSYIKLRDRDAKTLLMKDVVGKGVDIRVLDNGDDHKVFVDEELKVVNRMTDRPEEDDNRARWGLYTPRSAIDRDILMFVTGAYVGPAGEGPTSPATASTMSFWEQLIACFVPDWVQSWFSRDDPEDNSQQLQDDIQYITQQFGAEPDPEFLSQWYDNPENDGYGFF